MSTEALAYGAWELTPFTNRMLDPPFVNYGVRISPVRLKTRYGAARRAGLVHAFAAAASVLRGSSLHYGARWLCGGQTHDAVLIAQPSPEDRMCPICSEAGPVVYRYFDTSGRLLYVGSTVNLAGRRKHHARADWWSDVHRESVTRCRTRGEAAAAELHAIHGERPIHNRAPRSVVRSDPERSAA